MRDDHIRIRVGGAWLATASVSMIVALVLHGPIAPELADQMIRIGDHHVAWRLAHWLAAAALSFYAVAAVVMLTSRASLIRGAWSLSAWGVILVGGLWTLNTAVAEATVLSAAAVSGRAEMFEAWWAYAEGNANGFAILALALAVIAASDARGAPGATLRWAAWAAAAAGVGAFAGWALGMWFEVGVGKLLWLACSILMSAWSAWFGAALVRSQASPTSGGVEPVRAPVSPASSARSTADAQSL